MTQTDLQTCLQQDFGDFPQMLNGWARLHPDKPALRDERGEISWAQMVDYIDRIAARLQQTGLAPGQSVAIVGTSCVAYALVFMAAVRAGGVAAPLTTSASKVQLQGMAADCGAQHIFMDRAKCDELGEDFMASMDRIILDEELEGWMADSAHGLAESDPQPHQPFNIIYSSGTTGIPKGIVHSHQMRWRQFASVAVSLVEAGLEPASLTSTPLYSNTTMVGFLPVLLAGGTVTIMGKFNVLRWLETAQNIHANVVMLVPVQYQRLLAEPDFDTFDLSALALKYCTSAPFSAALKREVLQRVPGGLIEVYSMTEGGVVCLLPCHEFPDKLHTVGRPAPGSELKVLDDNDHEVAAGEAGRLVGRSPTMMIGYKNQPGKTHEALWTDPKTGEQWMRMGDIGRVDADGFVELVGRAKDMIISGGFNIYPVDLEAELEKEADVAEAAVIGVPSHRWGETPLGFVTLERQARNVADILAAVNGRLGKTQRISALHAIETMPRSHIGKLLKTELRTMADRLVDELAEPG